MIPVDDFIAAVFDELQKDDEGYIERQALGRVFGKETISPHVLRSRLKTIHKELTTHFDFLPSPVPLKWLREVVPSLERHASECSSNSYSQAAKLVGASTAKDLAVPVAVLGRAVRNGLEFHHGSGPVPIDQLVGLTDTDFQEGVSELRALLDWIENGEPEAPASKSSVFSGLKRKTEGKREAGKIGKRRGVRAEQVCSVLHEHIPPIVFWRRRPAPTKQARGNGWTSNSEFQVAALLRDLSSSDEDALHAALLLVAIATGDETIGASFDRAEKQIRRLTRLKADHGNTLEASQKLHAEKLSLVLDKIIDK